MNIIGLLFTNEGFMPHGHCYLWTPGLLWLNIVSDSLIFLSYLTIPITLIYFIRKRRDVPFNWIFVAFGVFIFACGGTHAMEIWSIWNADYWQVGILKGITAVASVWTAIMLVFLIPKALLIPSPERLRQLNNDLQIEINERRSIEQQLQQKNIELEKANKAKDVFLANVSHELRTPLTLIMAPLEQLMNSAQRDVDTRAQLQRMRRATLLLLNRVDDILDVSKSDAGCFEPRWETVDLNELIPALTEDAATVAAEKNCTIDCEVDSALGAVSLDRRFFEKILINYTSNAIKFTPRGGHIHLRARAIDDEYFEFSVSDTGIGIPADKHPLLFQRFQQVDTSITRNYGGTGIGLALVKQLTELMGGQVRVKSEAGKGGSTFSVILPRGTKPSVAPVVPANNTTIQQHLEDEAPQRHARYSEGLPRAIPETQTAACENAPRVLVVDDDPEMRSYIADLLKDECTILTATDGANACDRLKSEEVDMVVSDIMMPKINGLELTERIKKDPRLRFLPVLLVTACGGVEASATGLEHGADDYIAKPFSPMELKARVHAALRMAKVQRELRDRSREAGIAMLASTTLHNLGNVLTGITVTSATIKDRLQQSKLDKLNQLAELINKNAANLPAFFSQGDHAQSIPLLLTKLVDHLQEEQGTLLQELCTVCDCAEHARGVIANQQRLVKGDANVHEIVQADGLLETALRLMSASFEMHHISVKRDYSYTGSVVVDRHKVLQILLNLLTNACEALRGTNDLKREINVLVRCRDNRVFLEVRDNGVGIDPRDLPQLLNQGFTTKKEGHGLGLHSSANWARELGGALRCYSDGVGRGATIILELPLPSDHSDGKNLVMASVNI